MATIDPNGVLIYQDTDNYTPIQTALNLAQSNLSALLGASTQIVKASSISDRNAKAEARGSISKTNPFVVWRADAADGLQLEYTTNGTTWRTISDKEYYDVQAALDVRFKKVANETARTSYVNEVGIANITTANPLAVYRANAPEGLRFEVTYNGTTWDPLPGKSYLDAQDTGWVPITPNSGFTASEGLGYRIKNGVVYLRGNVTSTSGPYTSAVSNVFTLPVEARVAVYARFPAASYASMTLGGALMVEVRADGTVGVAQSGPGSADVVRLSSINYPLG